MEQIILDEIEKLTYSCNSFEQYSPQYAVFQAQILILKKVLEVHKRKHKIALLKDNQDNYEMGLITPAEYAKRISEINSI